MAKLDKLVDILKAAGELTRLRLLSLLAQGELCVTDLTAILEQSQPRVSRHLKLLAEAGLVLRQTEGSWAYYRLADRGSAAELARRLVDLVDGDDGQYTADLLALKHVQKAHRSQAEAYFSQIAERWDSLRSMHVPESAVEAAIVKAVGTKKVSHLIDLGTGTGRMLELLAPLYHRATGIDSNREMNAIARAKLAQAEIAHAHVQLGDISRLSCNCGLADVIIVHQVLHYFDDPGHVLMEAAQVLEQNGRVVIVDFASHSLEFLRSEHAHRRLGLTNEQMADWAHAAGLKVTRQQEFSHHDGGNELTVCLWVLDGRDTQGSI